MKTVITSILTDPSVRDDTAVEAALLKQTVAIPWDSAPTN